MIQKALTRSYPATQSPVRFFGEDFFGPSLLRNFFPEEPLTKGWVPAIDIVETETGYEVVAELPGMSKKDVNVTLENNVLTISGERRLEKKADEGTLHRRERTFGSFSRSFTIPSRSDVSKVAATFKNGLLTLSIPIAEEAKARQIEIK